MISKIEGAFRLRLRGLLCALHGRPINYEELNSPISNGMTYVLLKPILHDDPILYLDNEGYIKVRNQRTAKPPFTLDEIVP